MTPSTPLLATLLILAALAVVSHLAIADSAQRINSRVLRTLRLIEGGVAVLLIATAALLWAGGLIVG